MLRDLIKPIHIVIASVAILIIALVLIWNQIYTSTNPIIISKVPQDATVYIDGAKISGNRTNLPNGTYAIKAEKAGFYSYEGTTIIDDNSKYIIVSLEPESDEAKVWAEEHQDEYLEQESTTRGDIGESSEATLANNPIIADLPIDGATYKVGYTMDSKDTSGKFVVITIHTTSGYRNTAIRDIYSLGYDPADYTIQFNDYTNPFKEYK